MPIEGHSLFCTFLPSLPSPRPWTWRASMKRTWPWESVLKPHACAEGIALPWASIGLSPLYWQYLLMCLTPWTDCKLLQADTMPCTSLYPQHLACAWHRRGQQVFKRLDLWTSSPSWRRKLSTYNCPCLIEKATEAEKARDFWKSNLDQNRIHCFFLLFFQLLGVSSAQSTPAPCPKIRYWFSSQSKGLGESGWGQLWTFWLPTLLVLQQEPNYPLRPLAAH